MKRLFFALWPDAETRRQCATVIRELKGYGRPVSVGNIHVTLLFLGATSAEYEQALCAEAANICVEPMVLTFDQLAYWKKPAVACLLSRQIDFSVPLLVERLRIAATAIGMQVDQREFQPHVTLLRKAGDIPSLAIEPITWSADRFCLVESHSSEQGVRYQVVKSWGAAERRDR